MKKVLGFPSVDTSCLMIIYIYKYIMLSVHFRKHAVFHIILLQKIMQQILVLSFVLNPSSFSSFCVQKERSLAHFQFKYAPHLAEQMFSLNRLQVIWTSQPFLNESVVTELRMHKCSPSPSRTYSLAVSFWIHSLEQICSCHCLKHLDSLILFENTHWLYIHYVLLHTQEENRENAAICKGISPLLFHKDVFFSHTLKSYIRI